MWHSLCLLCLVLPDLVSFLLLRIWSINAALKTDKIIDWILFWFFFVVVIFLLISHSEHISTVIFLDFGGRRWQRRFLVRLHRIAIADDLLNRILWIWWLPVLKSHQIHLWLGFFFYVLSSLWAELCTQSACNSAITGSQHFDQRIFRNIIESGTCKNNWEMRLARTHISERTNNNKCLNFVPAFLGNSISIFVSFILFDLRSLSKTAQLWKKRKKIFVWRSNEPQSVLKSLLKSIKYLKSRKLLLFWFPISNKLIIIRLLVVDEIVSFSTYNDLWSNTIIM